MVIAACIGAVAIATPLAAWSASVASYVPAGSGAVVACVSVHANDVRVSSPLARLWRSSDTAAAPARAHVVTLPVVVIDHEADAEPRATGMGTGAQLPHALLLVSATSATSEQRSLECMTYYLREV